MQRLSASCYVLHLPQQLDSLILVLLMSLAIVIDPECFAVS